jgi:hypothetical protein
MAEMTMMMMIAKCHLLTTARRTDEGRGKNGRQPQKYEKWKTTSKKHERRPLKK